MSDSESAQEDNEITAPEVKKEEQKDSVQDEEEEEVDKNKQNNKSPEKSKENNKKSPKKAKKEEEEDQSDKSEDDDEDDDDEDSEPKLGLLDRPLEITGSRERKKVERFNVSFKTSSKDKHDIPEGDGDKLGDCFKIEEQIQKTKTEELKVLHKILFNRPGSSNEIKKNIRKFCGFTFTKNSAEYEKKKSNMEKLTTGVLKRVCKILNLERSGTKEDLISRIVDFLMKPSGKGDSKKKSTKGEKRKRNVDKKEKSNKGKKKSSVTDDNEDDDGDESSEKDEAEEDEPEEEVEEEEEEEEVEDSEDEPKKKKTKTNSVKKTSKENQTKKKRKSEDKPKKSEEKKKTTSKKIKKEVKSNAEKDEEDDNDLDESSDDEPLLKKTKSPPTNDEIKQLVKKILDDADLEEITMKKVIKQVFDEYPDFDLGEKKDYIKSTVKSLIS